ncbi:MAG: Membrane-associated zinc metalloprotease [Candidatus Peregrinibacteria bacterium GW2011_GWA2_47_7]|nr:MAG: Membrane-associated zinc metalloprotease [Candidatus Peregrinibacteria bacterium GW2011_GWA2_47_7]
MDIFLTVIAVVVIFSVLVLVHEWGHFIMAKRAGIKVLEFGFGFPPRLFKFKKGETVYSFNAVPIGGFVKLYGEDMTDPEAARSKRSFAGKSAWVRTKVIVAGVVMNFLLAYVLLTVGFTVGIEPLIVTEQDLFHYIEAGNVTTAPGVYVKRVNEKSSAESAGVLAEDELLQINGHAVVNAGFIEILRENRGKDIDVLVRRNSEMLVSHLVAPPKGDDFGFEFKPYTLFPRPIIQKVDDKSPAERAGLRRGDVVLAVNDEAVYSPHGLAQIFMRSPVLKLNVLRVGQTHEVVINYPRYSRTSPRDRSAKSRKGSCI